MIAGSHIGYGFIVHLAGSPDDTHGERYIPQSGIDKIDHQKGISFFRYISAVLIAWLVLRLISAQMHHAVVAEPAHAGIFFHSHFSVRGGRAAVYRRDKSER